MRRWNLDASDNLRETRQVCSVTTTTRGGAISRHHDDWKRRLHGRPLFALSTRLDNRFSVVFDQGAVVYVGGLENRLLGFGQF